MKVTDDPKRSHFGSLIDCLNLWCKPAIQGLFAEVMILTWPVDKRATQCVSEKIESGAARRYFQLVEMILSNANPVLTNHGPFNFPVKQPFLKKSRGDRRNFEPAFDIMMPFVMAFLPPLDPHLISAGYLARITV